MKIFVAVLCTLAALINAESPVRPLFIARYTAVPSQQIQQGQLVPYPVAALRPSVPVLARQQELQPQQPPQTFYYPAIQPNPTQAKKPERNSTAEETTEEVTTEALSESVQGASRKDQKKDSEKLLEGAAQPVEQGIYYLYHPSGVLQKVDYSTSNDIAKMAYIAQLKYQNVDPIKEPIYTYDPESYVLQQLRL